MTREKAISLVDQKVQSLCGLSVMDLPDTPEICDLYDTLEEVDEDQAIPYLEENVDMGFIEDLVYS